jgi:hypothetical protein
MAIAKKPTANANTQLSSGNQLTPDQQAFINDSGPAQEPAPRGGKKVPVMLRVDPGDLARIDRAAKKIGLKRAAYILSSAIERTNSTEP